MAPFNERMSMNDRVKRDDTLPPQRRPVFALIASLFVSLLMLLGWDAFACLEPQGSTHGAFSRSDGGQVAGRGPGGTLFLAVADQSSRPKLRPNISGDGCLFAGTPTPWMGQRGHLLLRIDCEGASFAAPLPYWSRAPPAFQQTT